MKNQLDLLQIMLEILDSDAANNYVKRRAIIILSGDNPATEVLDEFSKKAFATYIITMLKLKIEDHENEQQQ